MNTRRCSLTVLADNIATSDTLLAEHGWSCWVETPEARILFDTGLGTALPHNAAALTVPLACADAVVLSHGHYDHTGALAFALQQAARARIFVHPASLSAHYSLRTGTPREIGMPSQARKALEERSHDVTWTSEPTCVAPGVFVTGSIPRKHQQENEAGYLARDPAGAEPDFVEDDQAMWIETPKGPCVLLGCAHAGLINTLDYIASLTHTTNFAAVVGGFHLASASRERLDWTIRELNRLQVEILGPCHCTGDEPTERLRSAWGDRAWPGGSGRILELKT